MIARISARIFVGFPLCRDEEWIKESVDFTVNIFQLQARLSHWNPLAELLFARFTKELRVVERSKENAIRILGPEILRRRAAEKKARESGHEWTDKPNDMLQWLDNKKDALFSTVRMHAIGQLGLSMAAIHTTSMGATQCLYEAAARPDVSEDLLAEMEEVLSRHNGILTREAMNEMYLLDSFIKEVLRLNPLGVCKHLALVGHTGSRTDIDLRWHEQDSHS